MLFEYNSCLNINLNQKKICWGQIIAGKQIRWEPIFIKQNAGIRKFCLAQFKFFFYSGTEYQFQYLPNTIILPLPSAKNFV
jgi:hypothetical protein